VGSVEAELGLVALAAMLSPTTLSFSIFALVLGERPLRTGLWFYAGALGATLAVGIVAGLVLGDVAASDDSNPKTWVAVVDVAAAILIVFLVVRALRRPPDPKRTASMIEKMSGLASSPAIAILAAGATLANPGGFIPLALKEISELDEGEPKAALLWIAFAVISLLPLLVAIVMLIFAPERALRVLARARAWLERNARTIAAVLLLAVAAALLRNGIAGLTD
jgi:Sap-like sulfolipid-1-addressing protein